MRYPKFLPENGTIGIIAPSCGAGEEPYKTVFDEAVRKLKARGYDVLLGPNCYLADGIGISTTPQKCGQEVNDMFTNPDADVIISCSGGELMCEDLNYIDFNLLAEAEPKWFMGYSDNTNLTFLLPTLCDTAAIYGPNAKAYSQKKYHRSLEMALDLLHGKNNEMEVLKVEGFDRWQRESLKSDEDLFAEYNLDTEKVLTRYVGDAKADGVIEMTGRLLGGCMDCLANIVGTRFDRVPLFNTNHKEEGIIWFMESCDLNVMSIRRALWQMENAGWFRYVKGFIIGRPCCYGQELFGMDQYNAVTGILGKYNVPIIMDADIGHLPPQMPLITGAMATVVSADDRDIRVNMSLE